jgi:hypothetical protein
VPDSPGGAQEQPNISADGSTVAYVTGPELGQRVSIYDRRSSTAVSPSVLAGRQYQAEPSVSATGRYVVVDRQRASELVAHLWVFDRQTGALSPGSPTWTGSGEDQPAIADPAPLVDVTPPGLGLQCQRQQTTVSCTLKVNEPISGAATLRRGRHIVAHRRLTTSTPRTLRFTVSLGRAKPNHLSVVAAVKDSSGNRTSSTVPVR